MCVGKEEVKQCALWVAVIKQADTNMKHACVFFLQIQPCYV